MIEYIEGDIFMSPAQVIVNTVNTVGVMGKGIALEYKNRYPKMFEKYRCACENKSFKMGKLMICREQDHWILLFPTKENWRLPSKLDYIEKGLLKFTKCYSQKNITSIAFPRLGCGNGELEWSEVKPLMERYLQPLPIDVYIYLNNIENNIPEHKLQKVTTEWLRANAKDMSFTGLVDDIKLQSAIVPYTFTIGAKTVEMTFIDDLIFSCDDTIISLTETDFYLMWDNIRNTDVFCTDKNDNASTFIYGMLLSLGYLSRIRILDKKTGLMKDGYQLNEGLGRAFVIKETK